MLPFHHLLGPTIQTPSSPNTDGHAPSSIPLNSCPETTSTTSPNSLFHLATIRTANDLHINPVVRRLRKIVFPFPLRVLVTSNAYHLMG